MDAKNDKVVLKILVTGTAIVVIYGSLLVYACNRNSGYRLLGEEYTIESLQDMCSSQYQLREGNEILEYRYREINYYYRPLFSSREVPSHGNWSDWYEIEEELINNELVMQNQKIK